VEVGATSLTLMISQQVDAAFATLTVEKEHSKF